MNSVIGRIYAGYPVNKLPDRDIWQYVIEYENSYGKLSKMFVSQKGSYPEDTYHPIRFRFDLMIEAIPKQNPSEFGPRHFTNVHVTNAVPLYSIEEIEYEKWFIKSRKS